MAGLANPNELQQIENLLKALESALGGEALAAAQKPLLEKRAALVGTGASAQGDNNQVVGQEGILVNGNIGGDLVSSENIEQKAGDHAVQIVVKEGGKVVIGEDRVEMPAVDRHSALGRYLEHVIAHNRYLQHQGIRSGGRLVNLELDQIYITLRATQQRTARAEESWLAEEAALAPGEHPKYGLERTVSETVNVRVEQALGDHRHLVVLGDPGSGKTTLLRYLALVYARDLAQNTHRVADLLKLDEAGCLPILLPLRQIGAFLRDCPDKGTDGCGLLVNFLFEYLKNQRIEIPRDFFDTYLEQGRAVVLLDGMDEVADPELRGRVARLVESFTLAYAKCRFVVTSRIVGYSGPARLTGDYTAATVRDFTLADVELFLKNWHRLIAVGQMGPGESAENTAANQTAQLMQAIQGNERIRELAINPLLLTVLALVHRDRVKLPDRRAELYAEAVDVLLGKWDEARGVKDTPILDDRPFDTGDRRLLLQEIALNLHEHQQKEIAIEDLRRLLSDRFAAILGGGRGVRQAVERFQTVIEERTGLLAARGEGIYAFSHLTFQEYLAALAIAGRDDYITCTLEHCGKAWWREVILLEAGYLSTQSKERTSKLIRAIADKKQEPEPYHNLVLASECLKDVGANRIKDNLEIEIQTRLLNALHAPFPFTARMFKKWGGLDNWVNRRTEILQALAHSGSGYWTPSYGEPEWIKIPSSMFWMGEGKESHKVELSEYYIARVPITNAQYALFVKHSGHSTPRGWEDERPPKGKEAHPVVNITLDDALAYCEWLSHVTGKFITLPSEAEWEKAARGSIDQRVYPWGEKFDIRRCNTSELGLGSATRVGIFMEGASPYGVLDMSGNVWELTRSLWGKDWDKSDFIYPYNRKDGRENVQADKSILHVLRGGSFEHLSRFASCSYRSRNLPGRRLKCVGFRPVISK